MDALERIKEFMSQRDWTEYRLAKESNLPKSTVRNLYLRNNQPTITTLESICSGFGITLSQFFAETDEAIALSKEQVKLLNQWARLTAEQKEDLLQIMKHF